MKTSLYLTIAFCLMSGLSCSSSKKGEGNNSSQDIPVNCPFAQSDDFSGLQLSPGFKNYLNEKITADTWYPSWASDGNLYSPWTDGKVRDLQSNSAGPDATTGIATLTGDNPMNLTVVNEALYKSDPAPYEGRYPCGSLVYNGIWYYGTYCLYGGQVIKKGTITYNWPWMGPFVGFRWSADFGKTWTQTPCTPEKPLFDERTHDGAPVKMGAPHFVDFGKNSEYSPDGKAYLVGHGASKSQARRFGYDSWITGDEIYIARVSPGIENMNDVSKFEFWDGQTWTNNFSQIQPIASWPDNMGCVTMTYNAPLKRYLMCVTDGGTTGGFFNTYILESKQITGPWKMVQYFKHFGEQAYFVNIPSKFISSDGFGFWLCYSANFASDWDGLKIKSVPAGSCYSLCLQEVKLTTKIR
jgi:hypothetical protein